MADQKLNWRQGNEAPDQDIIAVFEEEGRTDAKSVLNILHRYNYFIASTPQTITVENGMCFCPNCLKENRLFRLSPHLHPLISGKNILLYCRYCKAEYTVDIEDSTAIVKSVSINSGSK